MFIDGECEALDDLEQYLKATGIQCSVMHNLRASSSPAGGILALLAVQCAPATLAKALFNFLAVRRKQYRIVITPDRTEISGFSAQELERALPLLRPYIEKLQSGEASPQQIKPQ